MKVTAKNIADIAKELRFELSAEVQEDFANFFDEHLAALEALQAIDTTGINPFTHVNATPMLNALREDTPETSLSQAQVLSNASETKDNYISIKRKVDDD